MAYIPRLDANGMRNNPYWYSQNPLYNAGYGLPNCTCYAWGRFWENSDINGDYTDPPSLSTSDAEYWYGNTGDGYARGSSPALGAVLCLADGPYSGAGHVAVVEEIYGDGSILVSESNWGGLYFDTDIYYPPNYLKAPGYVFQGFIYNPRTGGGGGGGGLPVPTRAKWFWKKWWWKRQQELIK